MPRRKLLFLSTDLAGNQNIESFLLKKGLEALFLTTLPDLKKELVISTYSLVFLDIDAISVGNREIKELKTSFPETFFFCMSKDPFHPEIKEAISNYIFACMAKPLDLDELTFWIESIESVNGATVASSQNAH
ncbi:MAG: hypothetical protein A2V65_10330 [Deltaproteobacteria bacterium RBG_13_49_15]|nr:MAG: hypothetical protein A2V65_10330 [Deltaproteobacteria bacterium RBG_13_49_15]